MCTSGVSLGRPASVCSRPVTVWMPSGFDRSLVPELNYQGQFANLLTGATARAVHRLDRVPGRPMHVEDIVAEIRHLARRKRQIAAA